MSNGSRVYTSRMTLMPPPEVPGDGQVDFYSVGGDPNGVINGTLGDRAFEIGGTTKWVCLGGLVWQSEDAGEPPIGPASGDLSGTYPGPLVVGFNGIPIDTAAPANGDALLYNGLANEWQHAPIVFGGGPPVGPAGGDLGGLYPNPGVVGLQTRPVSPAAPAAGNVLTWNGAAWAPAGLTSASLQAIYGSFSDSTDQAFVPGGAFVVKYDTVEGANGVSVVNDPITLRPTRITVAQAGIYALTLSPQILHTGGGTEIITFWLRLDGGNVPRSASSLEMGNNNNRTLPYIEVILPMAAGQYVEWVFTSSTGTNLTLEAFPEVVGPIAIPAIPSVIAGVKLIGTT